jgi:hypothetical protein
MYQHVSFCDFCDTFKRLDRDQQFSYEGKQVLFDYFEERENDTGVPFIFNAIEVSCEWTEASWLEIADYYSIDIEGLDDEEIQITVRTYIEDRTPIAGEVSGGCVYESF